MRWIRNLFIVAIVVGLVAGMTLLRSEIKTTLSESQNPQIVISLGEDLNDEQKGMIMDYFSGWQNGRTARFISVSNQEERKYLEGLVDENLIGSRALSSVYLEILDKSRGIEVETRNITAITPFMYANALATAGIENARVIVSAPFEVSGTAALTGIIKAFELASGKTIDEDAKVGAHREIAETTKLGREIGSNKAEKLIYEVKRQVVEKKISDPEEIRRIIIEISADLNVNLSVADIDRIVSLMQNLNGLNLDLKQLNEQLSGLQRNISEVKSTGREASGLLRQLLDAIARFIEGIKALLA
ncbi:MAG: DUF1002 domain-containing protein [Syntrophomonadaceae bacterium]|nr:DUF1002 domain-containing protein [Syntrophomonadaceae bacterium]